MSVFRAGLLGSGFFLCLLPVSAQLSLKIVSPSEGALVSPGQTVDVRVEASGNVVSGMVMLASDLGSQFISPQSSPSPYRFKLKIPGGIRSGTYQISAVTGDPSASGGLVVNTIHVRLDCVQPAVTLRVEPSVIEDYYIGDKIQLEVKGRCRDGSALNITASPNTHYVVKPETLPPAIKIAPNGEITTLGFGSGRILVNNAFSLPFRVVHIPGTPSEAPR